MLFAALTVALSAAAAHAQSVVRYGISMADIPLTTGQPDHGAGAYQFTGYTIYDPLVAWQMNVADRPGKLVPGLATEWKVDDAKFYAQLNYALANAGIVAWNSK
jgi:peptide/nickel transport system substrate-binding protein